MKNLAAAACSKNKKDNSFAISGNVLLDKPKERRFSSRLLSSTEISTVYAKIVKKKKRAKFTQDERTKISDLNELLMKEDQYLIKQEREEFSIKICVPFIFALKKVQIKNIFGNIIILCF